MSPKRQQQDQLSSLLPTDYEESRDQAPLPPPRTMTLSPKTTKQRPARPAAAVASVDEQPIVKDGDGPKITHPKEQDKISRLARSSQNTGGDGLSQQTSVVKEPWLSTSTSTSAATAASTASAAAWIAISNSMEEELRALRKKVVLLEAEAKVHHQPSPPSLNISRHTILIGINNHHPSINLGTPSRAGRLRPRGAVQRAALGH